MNVLDLFSNIGGHALGLHAAGGFRTVQFVEFNERRRRLLSHHFPGIPVHDDVRTFDQAPCDLVIGGPPCQRTSVSAAIHGRRDGHTLWPDMLRIGINSGAKWFVVEQPPGNPEWETKVAGDLADAGFHCARVEFSAGDLGAPHIRRRVFILAHACLARLSVAWQAVPQEIDRVARAAAAGNPWHEGPPGGLRVANGPSGWLDRNAAVEAIGDSNPPAMATVIGRAIMIAALTSAYRKDGE
jgi:DNA (cytosine-5)-methyltransferase 1